MTALDVAMYDALFVQVLQALRYLPTHCCNLAFCHQACRDNICKRAALHILHHHPELILVEERVDITDDICMTRSPDYEDLIYDKIPSRLLVKVHLFNRNRKVCRDLISNKYNTRGTSLPRGQRVRQTRRKERETLTLGQSPRDFDTTV